MSVLFDERSDAAMSQLSVQLVESNSQKKISQQEEWKQHFIQIGAGGSDQFLSMLNYTNQALASVFEQVRSPYSGVTPALLEKAIQNVNLDNEPSDLRNVIDRTTDLVVKNSIFVQHPNCIAHLHTPPLLSSIAAEAMIAALNQSMDSWDQASSATYVEQKVIDWVCDKYQLGKKYDGVFTSGGTQSNLMGLLLARDWIADKISQHSIQKLGLPEYSSKLRIICSKKSHFTVQKSASLLGLGERSVCCVETNSNGTIHINSLEATLRELKAEGLIPFVLVGTAGTTDHGAIDDLSALSSIAQAEGMWFHVDAAYGGALMLSKSKQRLAGIEHADSLSVDFHKLFYQTVSCGAILIKDNSNFRYLRHHADYLNREDDELPNLVDKSIATTKRFDALKVFMTMQNVGAEQLGKMYDHLLTQTKQVADLIQNNDRFELLAEPSLSTVLFRSNSKIIKDLDKLNKTLRLDALTRGIAVLGETVVNHNVALKLTILNPCLKVSDFESLLEQIDNLVIEQEQIRIKTIMSILQIGAGGVGWVVAHKAAQNNDTLGDITIASRTIKKCDKIIESIKGKNNLKDTTKKLEAKAVNADDVDALVALIKEVQPDLVINAGPPWVNISIMEACYQAQVSYLDTSVAVDLCSEGQQVPEAYDWQWGYREKFKEAGITGILGAGFDPGVVSVFAAYAVKHLFDEIETIDVMDINNGDHGKKFATNFDPETNMLEIQGDSFYWENEEWKQVPCHTRMLEFDFPHCGSHKVYSMAHDEVRSMKEFIPAKRIEFWMGFGDKYLNYFNCMRDIGLLSPEPLTLHDGTVVQPLRVLKALLPDPTSLAPGYKGLTCIGTWVQGKKDGKERSVFIYNNADHEVAYKDVEHQAISYTTGVPAITAALQYFRGKWAEAGVFNMEQLDPDPFLETMPEIGLDWHVQELTPGQPDIKTLK